MDSQHHRARLLLGVAVAALTASSAFAQQLARIVIPAQPMAPALRELSRQTGVNILFEPKATQGKMAAAVGDSLTPEEAARRLVGASGLEVTRDSTGSLLIREVARSTKPNGELLRISAITAVQSAAGAQPVEGPIQSAAPAGLDEVVVTASRVRSGFSAPTPTTVVNEALIEKRGVTNIADVLNEVPAFRASATTATNQRTSGYPGGTFLDLRGLNGVGPTETARTLVLVDGHRYQPSVPNMLVDTNMIPTSLVERTEVVTGGASAAWGSDAIGGVVNMILKDHIDGIQGGVSYGQTDKNDNKDYSANLAAGNSFLGGRGHFMVGADYDKNLGIPNSYVSRAWGREEWGFISNPVARPAGVPQKVASTDVTVSGRMTPGSVVVGGPLNGLMFLPGGATAQFVPGSLSAGDSQIGCPTCTNEGITITGGSNLVNPVERWTSMGRATFDLTDNVQVWGELTRGQSWYDGLSAQRRDNAAITVRRDNAFLPAAVGSLMDANHLTTLTVGRIENDPGWGTPGQGGGFYSRATHLALTRIAGGFKGTIGKWKWDISGEAGKSEYTQFGQNSNNVNFTAASDAVRDSSGNVVCRPGAALNAAAPGCVPFNIFGQGSPSQAAIKYVMDYGQNHVVLQERDLAANINGELLQLPAGPLSVAGGLEYRNEQVATDVNADSAASLGDSANYAPYHGSYHDEEGYLEVAAPLLKNMTLVHALDFNAAVRETDYSNSGAVTTWKVGATYEPTEDFRFRFTRSRDIRAPNLAELYSPGSMVYSTVNNPRNNGASGQVQTFLTGNAALKPEAADTLTGGIVFQPTFIRGLHASLDYYHIQIQGVIGQYIAQNIINGCQTGNQTLCAMLTYNGNSLDKITLLSLNLNKMETQGYDVEVAYRVPQEYMFRVPGQLSFSALGTNVRQLATTSITASGAPGVTDRAGQQLPKWTWNFTTNYDIGRFSLQAQVRFLNGIVIDSTYLDPSDPGYSPTLPNSTNYNHEPDPFLPHLEILPRRRLQPGRSQLGSGPPEP